MGFLNKIWPVFSRYIKLFIPGCQEGIQQAGNWKKSSNFGLEHFEV